MLPASRNGHPASCKQQLGPLKSFAIEQNVHLLFQMFGLRALFIRLRDRNAVSVSKLTNERDEKEHDGGYSTKFCSKHMSSCLIFAADEGQRGLTSSGPDEFFAFKT